MSLEHSTQCIVFHPGVVGFGLVQGCLIKWNIASYICEVPSLVDDVLHVFEFYIFYVSLRDSSDHEGKFEVDTICNLFLSVI